MQRRVLWAIASFAMGCSTAHAGTASIDWRPTPAQIAATCRDALAAARTQIAARPAAPPLAVVVATETALAQLDEALLVPRLLAEIATDDAVRTASATCNDEAGTLRIGVGADPALYTAAAATAMADPATAADDRALAARYAENGRRGGAALAPPQRAALGARLAQLRALETAYVAALGADRTTITVTDAENAALPASVQAASTRGERGLVMPVDNRSFELVMRHAPAALRERYWRAFYARGGSANVRRLEQALALRTHIARTLGYRDWATCQLASRMAGTPQRALALVRDVDAALLPRARAEIAGLAAAKRADGDRRAFAAWDYAYYQDRADRARHALDSEALRRYFPVERVVPAVLREFETLFALRFRPVEPAHAWADGVQRYAIVDGDTVIGEFYLDLAPRPGKFLRPANYALRAGRALPDGGRVLPISSIIGNGPAAAPGAPASFTHRDLVDFFHEFGHVMHTTLSTARYATLYGANVRADFVEAPSQIFENWAWRPDVLRRVSSHVDDGTSLPDAFVRKLVASRAASAGAHWTRQAMFAAYDLAVHGADARRDTTRLWHRYSREWTALAPVVGTRPQASFLPLMGGYDAAYYGYLWSRVYAQDLYSAFAAGGVDDPELGLRYRRTILAPGGSEEPDALVERFLGRKADTRALYADIGLETTGSADATPQ